VKENPNLKKTEKNGRPEKKRKCGKIERERMKRKVN
jgi:hypothetical protein